jgi:hypothetical protein
MTIEEAVNKVIKEVDMVCRDMTKLEYNEFLDSLLSLLEARQEEVEREIEEME